MWAARVLAVALTLWAAPEASADFWRWVDEGGVAHYTTDPDRIPRAYRDRAERVVPSAPVGPLRPRGGAFDPASAPAATTSAPRDPGDGPGESSGLRELRPGDPRSAELLQLERRLLALREEIKTLISEQRGTASEFTSDPRLLELSDELPGLQERVSDLRRELGAAEDADEAEDEAAP